MPVIADKLRNYAVALGDPTRGSILIELDLANELTATQLARRLGLNPNNVYHHMRVLLQLGVVDPPHVVPGDTYVEKYYRINPEIRAAVHLDSEWYYRIQDELTVEDRQAMVVGMCLTMSHLLRRAAQTYGEMDPVMLDRAVRDQHLVMVSMDRVSREELTARSWAIRDALTKRDPLVAEDVSSRTDLMLIAGLPALGDNGNGHHE